LAVGSRAWYGADFAINGVRSTGNIGFGASADGNTTAGVRTYFGEGITVSGMDSATVQGNTFSGAPISQAWTKCPVGNVFASVRAGLASGSVQEHSDIEVNQCMSDSSPQ